MSLRSDNQSESHRSTRPQISVESIDAFVRSFYRRVQEDPLIGPVFDARIDSWEPHLQRMVAFWRAVSRAERTYSPGPKGSPQAIHQGLEEVDHEHFDRWLELFAETLYEILPEPKADWVFDRAEKMRRGLSRHLGPRPEDSAGG